MRLREQLQFIKNNCKIKHKEFIEEILIEAAKADRDYAIISADKIDNRTLEWLKTEGLTVTKHDDFREGDYYRISWNYTNIYR